jgi:hypothetical protein
MSEIADSPYGEGAPIGDGGQTVESGIEFGGGINWSVNVVLLLAYL